LDPDRKMSKGFEQYFDASDILNVRTSIKGTNFLISFKTITGGNDPDATGQRWLAVCNLRRTNAMGIPGFPWTIWPLETNDLCHSEEGTDFGQCWFTDAHARADGKYYVHQFSDNMTGVANRYGDFNGVVGNPANIVTYFRTGWMDYEYMLGMVSRASAPVSYKRLSGTVPFSLAGFYMDGDWEGTPAVADRIVIYYRFNGWTNWRNLVAPNVRFAKRAGLSPKAYGRYVQFQFMFVSKTARAVLYKIGIKIKPLSGYQK